MQHAVLLRFIFLASEIVACKRKVSVSVLQMPRPPCPHLREGAAGHLDGPLTLLGNLAGDKQQVAQQLLLALRGLGQLCQAVARLWNHQEVRGGLCVQPL